MTSGEATPRWEQIADRLESQAAAPTKEQLTVAEALGVDLPADVPAPVAAVVLKHGLRRVLFESAGREGEIPDMLTDLEDELQVAARARLTTHTDAEVSAWFAARYMLMTARGLREHQPRTGDIVRRQDWAQDERRVISSIGDDGRVYMRGRPPRRAWPNHLEVIERDDEPGYADAVRAIDAGLRNSAVYRNSSFDRLAKLDQFKIPEHVPSPEAIRALEDLLESGDRREKPFQTLLTRYPSLLAATVLGGSQTYVIPKKRLGSEYVPDFLALGVNSLGPQWLTVEIEAARHGVVNQDGTLSPPTRHGVKQVQDWREWLTTNVAYAQDTLNLYGLTTRAPGLVVIGRGDPTIERQASRSQSQEGSDIAIHTWDWILRSAKNLARHSLNFGELARQPAERHDADIDPD